MTQFDDLCQEAEAKDQTEWEGRDIHEVERVFEHEVDDNDNDEDLAAVVLAGNQCSWCGFRGHTLKIKSKCPQHPDYNDTEHSSGDKMSNEWVLRPKQSFHVVVVTRSSITTVRVAPQCAS